MKFEIIILVQYLLGITLMVLKNELKQKKFSSDLNNVLIKEAIVYKKLSSLKSNKAHGDYGMGSHMLKALANKFKGMLTIIYNKSMSESKIAYDWKIANSTSIINKCKSMQLLMHKINITCSKF